MTSLGAPLSMRRIGGFLWRCAVCDHRATAARAGGWVGPATVSTTPSTRMSTSPLTRCTSGTSRSPGRAGRRPAFVLHGGGMGWATREMMPYGREGWRTRCLRAEFDVLVSRRRRAPVGFQGAYP